MSAGANFNITVHVYFKGIYFDFNDHRRHDQSQSS